MQEKEFSKLKNSITRTPVLRYFDTTKTVAIQCAASSTGLGATLLRDSQPFGFASRALASSTSEQQYAQIENEVLACVFACKRFHHYTYGRGITAESAQKLLEAIDRKPLEDAPKQLHRMSITSP